MVEEQGSNSKPVVFFVLGGPGSGKGTQCAKLVENHGFVHLSAGDLLRAERDSGSEQAQLINNIILEGKIVPVKITVGLIKKAMEQAGWEKKKFVIDGFPRNQDNVDGLNEVLGDTIEVPFVLFLDASEEAMIERIKKRGEDSGRNDDNIEVLKKRFATLKNETMPIIEDYDRKGMVKKVEANRPIEEVYTELKTVFADYI